MEIDKQLEIVLKEIAAELAYNKQFKQRKKQMFEYTYRLITQKKDITKQIELLEKLNINTEKLAKKLDDIDNKLSKINNKYYGY